MIAISENVYALTLCLPAVSSQWSRTQKILFADSDSQQNHYAYHGMVQMVFFFLHCSLSSKFSSPPFSCTPALSPAQCSAVVIGLLNRHGRCTNNSDAIEPNSIFYTFGCILLTFQIFSLFPAPKLSMRRCKCHRLNVILEVSDSVNKTAR